MLEQGQNGTQGVHASFVHSDSVTRTALTEDTDHQLTTIVFSFEDLEEDVALTLDNSVFLPNSNNGRIRGLLIPYLDTDKHGDPIKLELADITFQIALHESNPGRVAPRQEEGNELADQLAGLQFTRRTGA